jgi:hypothetical protein
MTKSPRTGTVKGRWRSHSTSSSRSGRGEDVVQGVAPAWARHLEVARDQVEIVVAENRFQAVSERHRPAEDLGQSGGPG